MKASCVGKRTQPTADCSPAKVSVFLIPSWYPSPNAPLAGIFTREQAQAIAQLAGDVRMLVSTWGHADGTLSPRNPAGVAKALLWRMRQKSDQVVFREGIWEIFNPALSWSHRLPFGGARQLLAVNRRNFKLAEQEFGPIDVIHAHVSYPAGWIAARLSEEFGVPYVITEHMSPFPFDSLLYNGALIPELEMALRKADRVIAVSKALAGQIGKYVPVVPVVIANMVDERRFSVESVHQARNSKCVFFTLGMISPQKGIDILLEAIARWNPSPELFEFHIGGSGPTMAVYQALAKRLGLEDRVHWLGALDRNEAALRFKACDVFVLPSRHESFGVVYAEALACGKPVIGTRCGGPESIINAENGILVDVGDVDQLAKAMSWMAEQKHTFDPVFIRNDFESRFSRAAVVRQVVDIYRQLVRGQ